MKVLPLARMAALVPSLRPPLHRWRGRHVHCCSISSLHSPAGLGNRSSLLPAVPCRLRSVRVSMLRAPVARGSRQLSGTPTPSWLLSSLPRLSFCASTSGM